MPEFIAGVVARVTRRSATISAAARQVRNCSGSTGNVPPWGRVDKQQAIKTAQDQPKEKKDPLYAREIRQDWIAIQIGNFNNFESNNLEAVISKWEALEQAIEQVNSEFTKHKMLRVTTTAEELIKTLDSSTEDNQEFQKKVKAYIEAELGPLPQKSAEGLSSGRMLRNLQAGILNARGGRFLTTATQMSRQTTISAAATQVRKHSGSTGNVPPWSRVDKQQAIKTEVDRVKTSKTQT